MALLPTEAEVLAAEQRLKAAFEAGAAVRVLKGPFKGLAGVVELADADKLVVSLTVMGQATPVELPPRHVEAVEPG